MKGKLEFQIAATNLASCVRIFAFVILLGSVAQLFTEEASIDKVLEVVLFLLLYGWVFWLGFVVLAFVLDMLLLSCNIEPVSTIIVDFFIIGGLFIFWGFYYEYPLWFPIVGIYGLSQWVRSKEVSRILSANQPNS